jgi:spore coat protein U-like protein
VRRLVLALLLALAPAAAQAQGRSTTTNITALVIGASITFTSMQSLDFATVTRGVPKTVIQNTAAAAKVRVAGTANAFAQIRFTLPTQLPNIQAVPGINMPISFAANSARWRRGTDAPGGGNIFNPNVGANNARFGPPVRPYFFVYLGGTVNPSLTQAPGVYQGTIIVTITYL